MNVGILGSGGREHAICEILKKSTKITEIYCFPGNAGTDKLAKNVEINLDNFENLKNYILEKKIDFIIVGPEKPLVDGIVDYLEKYKIKVFGPNKIAAQLEGSKIFTKKICEKYNIPTAKFGIFRDVQNSKKFLRKTSFPIVVKADNLASGKGVYICKNFEESCYAIDEIFGGKFGEAKKVLIEEFLEGEEMSYFIITDGITVKKFGTAQDHKRALEGDKGKNTGGMGAYSPSRLINDKLEKKINDRIIKPTLEAIKNIGSGYKGFLYAGLMIVNNEPFLIEYNVRIGDPECQTILPTLKSDLLDILLSCCENRLNEISIDWYNKKSLCVVLCSKGYPEKFEKNVVIKNLEKIKLKKDCFLFHAGTISKKDKVFAIGGRVLNFVSVSDNYENSRENIFTHLDELAWSEGFFRKDIGYKVIKK